MIQWEALRHEDLEYFRFTIRRLGTIIQTVYVYSMDNVLIDTAQSQSRKQVWEVLGSKPIDSILITHHHEDHSGNAASLAKKFNAKVYAHPIGVRLLFKGPAISPLGKLMSGGVQKVSALPVDDNQLMDFGKISLQAIHTPGHTDDHLSFYDARNGRLFPGDLYVADRIKYFETSESLALQIQSLEKLTALDFDALFCSHNPKPIDGKQRLERKLELFREFYEEVARMYYRGMTAGEIFKATGRKEHNFYKYITLGNFSAINMVRSVIREERKKQGSNRK